MSQSINDIISEKECLQKQLRIALSTMEKKDDVYNILSKIKENQRRCPHFSSQYNWAIVDDICPYCGKRLQEGE